MDILVIINILNQYNGLILVITTIIGFIFITKQIKIAKNKDLCTLIYVDINLCFKNFTHDYKIFFKEFEEVIKNPCLTHAQLHHYYQNYCNQEIQIDYEIKLDAIKERLEQFHYEVPCEKLIRIIDQYQWWFDFIQYKPQSFPKGIDEKLQKKLNDYIKSINLNNLLDIYSKATKGVGKLLEDELFEKLREIEESHNSNIENLRNKTNKLLSDITKKSL